MSREFSRRSLLVTGLTVGAAGALPGRAVAGGPAGAGTRGRTAIVNVTVIDGTGAAPRPGQTVVVLGDRIVGIGRQRDVPVPTGASIVDGHGKFLIPGLHDMHVHSDDLPDIFPPLFLANGVTTTREMSGAPFLHERRRQIEAGDILGPRMVIASPMIDGTPSLWSAFPGAPFVEVSGETQARDAVRQAARDGADFIKVYSRLSPSDFHAVADEAHRLGLPFAGHCPDGVPLGEASDAGQRSVEHLFWTWYSTSRREAEVRRALAALDLPTGDYNAWFHQILPIEWTAAQSFDPVKAAALFARLNRNGTRQVPTLTVHKVLSRPDLFSPTDPRMRYLPDAYRQMWQWELDTLYLAGRTAEETARYRELFTGLMRLVGAMNRSGSVLMAGTYTGTPYVFPGFGLHDELELMVQSGLSSMEALQTATRNPAVFLGRGATSGTVKVGNVADLVVLDGDPLADIRNTRRVHAVVVRGELISAERRTRMLADVEAAARASTARPAVACACHRSPVAA
jgi:imidazolonepropionase-like amidohydrolase